MVDNSVPAIRTFQMDGTAVGKLSSAVNLFRGDINLTQSILTLPGRAQNSGLDIDISLQYQSNVTEAAATWNRDAPTGILGLGWNFPLSYIDAADSGSPVPGTRQYTLYDNGTPNSLYRQAIVPLLFELPSSMASGLKAGQPVPGDVLDAFHGMGLPLDSGATVAGTGPWTIDDPALQQQFALETGKDGIAVRYGGECYALQNYKFYSIFYFPAYERWLIVTETGMAQSYGGLGGETPDHFRTGIDNSIAWEVWWKGANARPVWTGASNVTQDQIQVARAWYLTGIRDRFGDHIGFAYNGWSRDPQTGLIPDVEQRVGTGGLPFTKAVYLTRVTDVFGRMVELGYGDKLWSDGENDPREYCDPHRAVPSTEPSPYQDRYETKFLSAMTAHDANGVPLFGYRFEYDPRPGTGGRGSEVANVTDSSGRLEGDTYKRFLTGIMLVNADDTTAPPLNFGYYLQKVDDPQRPAGYSPAALETITYPEGAVAHYDYSFQSLAACDRSVAVTRPTALGSGGSPRVFFGGDYAVVTYYNANAGRGTLTMQVFTWTGAWLGWQLTEDKVLDTQGLDLNSLDVLADSDFLALHFNRLAGTGVPQRAVYVFQRDTARQGQWVAATINGRTTAPDTPSLVYDNVQLDPGFASGASFFLVSSVAGSSSDFYERVTFRWTDMAWTVERFPLAHYSWFAARSEYYALLDTSGTLTVHYLDGNLTWQAAAPVTISGLYTLDTRNVAVVPGNGMVVVSNLLASGMEFQLWPARWDANYAVSVDTFDPVSFTYGSGTTANTIFVPTIVEDTMIAVNGVIYRFSGTQWLGNQALTPLPSVTDTQIRYAYGPDWVFQILAPTDSIGLPTGFALGFDATRNESDWPQGGTALKQTLPAQQAEYLNWPSSGGSDWAIAGPYVYFRGIADDWGLVVGKDATIDLASEIGGGTSILNSDSLISEAPSFLSFVVNDGANPVAVSSVMLRNGAQLGPLGSFDAQKMTYPGMPGGITGAGVYAGGPQMFMTYPAKALSFDSSDTVYLNHFAGTALQGNIAHFAVERLTIDYGYESPVTTLYAFDTTTAACDPSGRIVKYYKARLYPDCTATSDPANGYTENLYLNGLTIAQGNYYNMLDGMLRQTATYDSSGVLRESTTSEYKVFEQVSLEPGTSGATAVQLHGGFATTVAMESFRDGLTTRKVSDYVAAGQPGPFGSSPVLQHTDSYAVGSVRQTFENGAVYGAEIYAGLRAIHALADIAETYAQASPVGGSGDKIPIKAQATTYQPWATLLGDGVTAWACEARFGLESAQTIGFPFGAYHSGETPAGWALGQRFTQRTRYGLERESRSALGVPTATLYAKDDQFPIAQCANAAAGGMTYSDFQPYDPFEGWTFANTLFRTDLARTGVQSLELPGGAKASAAVTIAPHQAGAPYVAGCWYRTDPGYAPAAGSGLSATVTVDGAAQPAVTLDFEATDGAWIYRTLPVPVPAGGSDPKVSITLRIANATAAGVQIDAALLVPLANGLTGRTFDIATHNVLASMVASGSTSFSYYDDTNRTALAVGPTNQVQEIALNYLSRSGSANGSFDPASPNAAVTGNAAGGGQVETFRDAGAWRQRWSTDGDGSAWTVAGDVLTHAGSAPGTLSWTGTEPTGAHALYFELVPGDGTTVSVTFGDITIGFDGKGYTATQGSTPIPPVATRTAPARQWLVLADQGIFLFFAGGQLLFSAKRTPSSRAMAITLGGATTGLRNLATGNDMRLGLTYNDAAERQRQAHQLVVADSFIVQTVNDGLNRSVATTKAAPGSFGSGASQAPLQYHPGFVDVAGFLANLGSTWQMPGDVADYYRGQQDGPVKRSDDQGYPYYGTRFEASPREVTVETGAPGKECAIDLTVPVADRKTIQLDYGASNGGGDTPIFSVQTVTSPAKVKASTLLDMLTQQVGSTSEASDGSGTEGSEGLYSYAVDANGPSVTVTTRLPNATGSGPQQGDAGYVRTATTNPLQLNNAVADSDAGLVRFVHDSAGNLRFVQPAMDGSEAWYLYYKFDPLNRMIEQGVIEGGWDPAALRANADDPVYPTSGTIPTTAWQFDGDGSDPDRIGQKSSSTSHNPAPADDPDAGALTVDTEYRYAPNGQIASVATRLSGANDTAGTVSYTYNPLNEVVAIGYPQGCTPGTVHYGFNQLGHIVAVGSSPGADDIGSFVFSPDGGVAFQSLGSAWTVAASSNPRSNPVTIDTVATAGGQSLSMAFDYAPDGAMTARDVTLDLTGAAAEYHGTIGYDGQRRFNALDGTQAQTISSFDPNGNIWAGTVGGDATDFTYASGTDRVATATFGGTTTSDFAFNARGQQTAGLGRTLSYDRCIAMAVAIARGGNRIRLGYGDASQRVLKQLRVGDGRTIAYFNGASSEPLATFSDGQWTAYIQGPAGLLAIDQGGTRRYPLKDPTQSCWALVDASGAVAHYGYMPFGQQLVDNPGDAGSFATLFQGQEWDAEVGLYNFKARLYDPLQMRFLAPDPQNQFPSPYLFAGNIPLVAVDPSGQISIWAQVGIGIAMVAIAAVGLLATPFTGGASDAVAGSIDAALVGAEGVEIGAEVGAGVVAAEAAETVTGSALATIGNAVFSGTLVGAGLSGLQYDATHGRDFTAAGFFAAVGIGALSGAAGGLASGGVSALGNVARGAMELSTLQGSLSYGAIFTRIGTNALLGAVSGAVRSDVSKIVTNLFDHQPWYQDLGTSALTGGLGGAGSGAASSAWAQSAYLTTNAIGSLMDKGGNYAKAGYGLTRFTTALADLSKNLQTNDAYAIYGVVAFHIAGGYAAWGAYSLSKN